MKSDRIIVVFCIVQTSLLVWLGLEHLALRREYASLGLEKAHHSEEYQNTLQALMKIRDVDLEHTGQSIVWPELIPVQGTGETATAFAGFHFLVYFSELSCNVCQDRMSQFATSLRDQNDNVTVTVVVQASHQRYVNQYVRTNQIDGDVYFDEAASFAGINELIGAPVALLLHDNRVLAAHYPSPSFPDASDPFYDAVLGALER